jgi:hypothetical protein
MVSLGKRMAEPGTVGRLKEEMMAQDSSTYAEWPIAAPETRRFQFQIVERDAAGGGSEGGPRLQLIADSEGQNRLAITVSAGEVEPARREMFDRGYRGGISCVGCNVSTGSWRHYLNELDAVHILIELLGWTLTPEEQGVLDAVDDYGRRAPTGFTSNYLT